MKNALILHGTDGSPKSNWFNWLKDELEKEDYKVWLPQLPNSDRPNPKTYVKFLLDSDFEFGGETIIIGHSSGAVAIFALLEHLGVTVGAVYLVSAFKDDLGWNVLTDLFEEEFNFEKIKSNCKKFVFLHSDNDPHVPLDHAEYLSKQVGGELNVLKSQGHFNTDLSDKYKKFPALLELIRTSS